MQFNDSNTIGKRGEAAIQAYLEKKNWLVTDVSDVPFFQQIDVDALIQKPLANGKMRTEMIDYKCDSHSPRNFAIEIISNDVKNTLGCIHVTEANLWMYYFEKTNDLYIFNPADMVEHLNEKANDYRLIKHPTRSPYNWNDIWYHSHCYLVDIESAKKAMKIIHIKI